MAVTLTLSGPTTTDATVTASNAKAAAIMDDYLAFHEYDIGSMTDQEKADAFVETIKQEVVAIHRAQRKRAAAEAAAAQDWEP